VAPYSPQRGAVADLRQELGWSARIRFRDAPAAIDWLTQTLGFEEVAVHQGDDGTVHHAELAFEGEVIMLGSASDGSDGRMAGDFGPAVTYLAIDVLCHGRNLRCRRPAVLDEMIRRRHRRCPA